MFNTVSLAALLLASAAMSGCAYERSSTRFNPTAPTETAISASSPIPSVFSGSWGSSTIAGLPLGVCSDVKWMIATQANDQVAGTLSATCASGVSVSANLTGALAADKINLVARGTLSALGIPCAFNLNGTGARPANGTMKVDYTGTYCFGNVSGTEHLSRFANN
jgi:hypothetical protein